jgi:hypothetical protein
LLPWPSWSTRFHYETLAGGGVATKKLHRAQIWGGKLFGDGKVFGKVSKSFYKIIEFLDAG